MNLCISPVELDLNSNIENEHKNEKLNCTKVLVMADEKVISVAVAHSV